MKNVILLNNRSLHLYDFEALKLQDNIRISAVVFNKNVQNLSVDIKNFLHHIYVLPDVYSLYESLESFPKDALESIVRKELDLFPNTWIVAADELNNLSASFLRDKYNLQGTPFSIVSNFRNKVRQKEILRSHGVMVPNFISINSQNFMDKLSTIYHKLCSVLGSPFILKPIDMFGTIGVEQICIYNEFVDYFKKHPDFTNLVAEEFINGQLYHCDFIINDNQQFFAEVSEYIYNGLSFINGYNHGSLLLNKDNPLRQSIIDFCLYANSQLGLMSGCSHFEVFVTPDQKIIFLEAAARPAGSSVPLVFTKTFNKNYLNEALLAEIQQNPGMFSSPQEYHFWASFPKKTGKVTALNRPSLQSLYKIEWNTKIGDRIERPSLSLVERAGTLLAHNHNYDVLRSDFDYMRSFVALETE